MPIYALGDRVPTIDDDAYVHPDAVVIGDVRIGSEASVWPGAVLRGDYGTVIVGARTSVQDGTVLHATEELATMIGSGCVIGHLVHLEGCTIEDECLVGSNSVVLHRALVQRGATVGASAVVTGGMVVPPGALAVGIPASIRLGGSSEEGIRIGVGIYVENARRYRSALRRLG
ncbi:MAG TPA: gamma carbonic anhydrase family protein [Acidimicrobiales bacterium]|nr:gamma carbonic anhydrase family protein [Acidimicrobiales bacterium]